MTFSREGATMCGLDWDLGRRKTRGSFEQQARNTHQHIKMKRKLETVLPAEQTLKILFTFSFHTLRRWYQQTTLAVKSFKLEVHTKNYDKNHCQLHQLKDSGTRSRFLLLSFAARRFIFFTFVSVNFVFDFVWIENDRETGLLLLQCPTCQLIFVARWKQSLIRKFWVSRQRRRITQIKCERWIKCGCKYSLYNRRWLIFNLLTFCNENVRLGAINSDSFMKLRHQTCENTQLIYILRSARCRRLMSEQAICQDIVSGWGQMNHVDNAFRQFAFVWTRNFKSRQFFSPLSCRSMRISQENCPEAPSITKVCNRCWPIFIAQTIRCGAANERKQYFLSK